MPYRIGTTANDMKLGILLKSTFIGKVPEYNSGIIDKESSVKADVANEERSMVWADETCLITRTE